jgi:palmitoyltransferase
MTSNSSRPTGDHDSEESFAPTLSSVQRDAFLAACKGFLPNLEASLEKMPLNVVDDVGASLLHWACFKRKTLAVKLLLDRGIDASIRTATDSQTALHWACAGGSVDVIHLLWQRGIKDYEDKDAQGFRAIHVAVQNGHYSLVHYLCIRGVEVEARDNENETTLHWASIKGHLEIVRYLIARGCDPAKQDKRGFTALHWAVSMAHYPVATCLANDKNFPHLLKIKDNKGHTPRNLAPKDKRIFTFMLERAELPRRMSDAGYKALWIAIPCVVLSMFYLMSSMEFSFLFIALFLAAVFAALIYIIRPMFKPHPSADTMMIGLFYSHSLATLFCWLAKCFDYSMEHYGSLYTYTFVLYGCSMIAFHFYMVKSNAGSLRPNTSADNQEFLSEIERDIEPPQVCSSCLVRKPIRCKHDAVTNKCYIKFDHYCVWIFNAVGNDNHFPFMIMLGMCIVAHFWALAGYCAVFFAGLPEVWTWGDLWTHLGNDFFLAYLMVFQVINGTWESFLFFQQFQMIISNVTMNEMINWQHYPHFWKGGNAQDFENPFDHGYLPNLRAFVSQARTKDLYHLYHLQRRIDV